MKHQNAIKGSLTLLRGKKETCCCFPFDTKKNSTIDFRRLNQCSEPIIYAYHVPARLNIRKIKIIGLYN